MSFEVIPAIDVFGGRLARLTPNGPERVDAFASDPVVAAGTFAEAGAVRIHVVDMDLALTGHAGSLEVLRAVARLGVPVQASGGIVSAAEVEAALGAGASRVVLGSAALADRDAASDLIRRLGEALVVGIEADGETIRPRGPGAVELPLWDTLGWLAKLPVARFLRTEVARVGGLEGPDLDGVGGLARSTGRPVVAAGGIRGTRDLRGLASLSGVEGAIVGRALYEGLDLRDALAAVR